MGLDVKQYTEFVLRPTCEYLGLYSRAAEMLLLGTAAQESHFTYLDQLTPGDGPAYGIFQMEEPTHDDLLTWLARKDHDLWQKCLTTRVPFIPNVKQLHGNLYFATALCRIKYWRDPEPLPPTNDLQGVARYYKRVWNTYKGRATIQEFVANYRKYVQ